ncbi:MAG: AraC family transcriptional activator of pyochelin receptor [Bacteroidia bacterium]|jgi:AraC family transcriptional activator of pyochelin receptor
MTNNNIDKSGILMRLDSDKTKLITFDCQDEPLNYQTTLGDHHVHLFFCKQGNPIFQFSEHYQRPLPEGSYFTIYDQSKKLDVLIHAQSCKMVYVSLPPQDVHKILIDDSKSLVELGFEGFGVREYSVKDISFATDLVLDGLLNPAVEPNLLKSVYYRSKVLEILSFVYDVEESQLYDACPFLKEKDNVTRIKNARNILIEHMDSPPSLALLAKEIGMNEYNLKVGFKNVYGLPPFKYLQEYRLNYSKKLLGEGQWQVAEIADQIGYTSSSHFIEAFRKKFGNTPKKFMQSKV